jgi:hypothetical protein
LNCLITNRWKDPSDHFSLSRSPALIRLNFSPSFFGFLFAPFRLSNFCPSTFNTVTTNDTIRLAIRCYIKILPEAVNKSFPLSFLKFEKTGHSLRALFPTIIIIFPKSYCPPTSRMSWHTPLYQPGKCWSIENFFLIKRPSISFSFLTDPLDQHTLSKD